MNKYLSEEAMAEGLRLFKEPDAKIQYQEVADLYHDFYVVAKSGQVYVMRFEQ